MQCGLFLFKPMQLDFFTANKGNGAILIPAILQDWKGYYEAKAFREYYPQFHKVNSKIHRPKKVVVKPDPNDPERNITTYQDLNRISLALQKLIVSRKTAFTTGGTVSLKAKYDDGSIEQELYTEVQGVWSKNKLQFRNAEIFERMASETECCEIWYTDVNEQTREVKLKMNVFSPELGYELIPVFDSLRNLIAFGLKYQDKKDGKTYNRIDVYDDKEISKYVQETGYSWVLEITIPHLYGKIPVIYYSINQSVWQDVQNMIERLETLMSNFADTNDYNGSPILFAEGEIKGWADKGESGKVIQGEDGAKLSYVNWDSAPESIKLEIEKLVEYIFTITQTPNISFDNMKGIGDVSGVAFDRIMIDAHLDAKRYHTGVYGEGIQRRINLIKSMLSAINSNYIQALDMDITPEFSLFRIDNDKDRIENAMMANGNLPIMGQKESIAYAGLSDDPDATLEQITNINNQI